MDVSSASESVCANHTVGIVISGNAEAGFCIAGPTGGTPAPRSEANTGRRPK
jgi:hypothetical protein